MDMGFSSIGINRKNMKNHQIAFYLSVLFFMLWTDPSNISLRGEISTNRVCMLVCVCVCVRFIDINFHSCIEMKYQCEDDEGETSHLLKASNKKNKKWALIKISGRLIMGIILYNPQKCMARFEDQDRKQNNKCCQTLTRSYA